MKSIIDVIRAEVIAGNRSEKSDVPIIKLLSNDIESLNKGIIDMILIGPLRFVLILLYTSIHILALTVSTIDIGSHSGLCPNVRLPPETRTTPPTSACAL